MDIMSDAMQACIEQCLKCHGTCLSMAMNHCLQVGGKHTEPTHFELMMACAEMCRTSANMMLIGTELHKDTCRLCVEFCEKCASNCEAVGDMEECIQQCRACAGHCRAMAV